MSSSDVKKSSGSPNKMKSPTGSKGSVLSGAEDEFNVKGQEEVFEIIEPEEEPVDISSSAALAPAVLNAKMFLQNQLSKSGVSLYDHLSALINKILSEKPENIMEGFEEYSRTLKEKWFRSAADCLQDQYIIRNYPDYTQKLITLFRPLPEEKTETEDDEEGAGDKRMDLMELQYYFEQAGAGLSKNEMFCTSAALYNLGQREIIKKYRFWGKIFGLEKNYIIAEVELTEEETTQRIEEQERLEEERRAALEEAEAEAEQEAKPEEIVPKAELGEEGEEGEEEGEEEEEKIKLKPAPKIPRPPKSMYKKPPDVPPEKIGEGTNQKVYFVCNRPGEEWIELPNVTPQQITTARQIRRYFTGNLDTEMFTYPPFPGKEINYLRAQIARISAGTQISPLGFYNFGEDEEEEVEEEEGEERIPVPNAAFEPVPLRDLLDPSMSFWVHHGRHILKQGRTKWWNPKQKSEDEEEAEEEEEEEEVEPEVGPPMFTPLSEDAALETMPAWSVRIGSQIVKDTAIAFVRSNLWPGAFAFAAGRKSDNIYLGWGHKYVAHNYSPPGMESIQTEYPLGPEIMEIEDPSVEQEEAWRLAHEKKKARPEEEEEEEEEGEEEEDED
ncbi:radial spoke head protein 6 homolog A isoform X2 [Schistocerca gregaria]|uniref:radial spoke head protein 6 homolog A isoform X2 n=1 Tax=Schistocerca gregaria TaxID=7010 RepID=UPI00211EF87A|nr:radial spoke head protein 6 homolog A isoform X2 [Schistocerca gregaria]